MTRSVPPWTAKHDDAPIPKAVKLRVFLRCEGRCAITGRKLRPGDAFDVDHITPLSMGATRPADPGKPFGYIDQGEVK